MEQLNDEFLKSNFKVVEEDDDYFQVEITPIFHLSKLNNEYELFMVQDDCFGQEACFYLTSVQTIDDLKAFFKLFKINKEI